MGLGKRLFVGCLALWVTSAAAGPICGDPVRADLAGDLRLVPQLSHGEGMGGAVITPDGRLAVSFIQQEIKVWDLATGGLLRTVTVPAGVGALDLTPDGTRAVVGPLRGEHLVLDLATGEEIGRYEAEWGQTGMKPSVCVMPDGDGVLLHDGSMTAQLRDLRDGSQVWRVEGLGPVMALFPDRDRFVTGGVYGEIQVRSTDDGETVGRWMPRDTTYRDEIAALAVHPDGRRIVTAHKNLAVQVWDADEGALISRLHHAVSDSDGHWPTSLAITDDGEQVLVGYYDGRVSTWDLASGEQTASRIVHDHRVESLIPIPDGARVLTMTLSLQGLLLWERESGAVVEEFAGEYTRVDTLAALPGGHQVLAGGRRLWQWDMEAGALVRTLGDVEDVTQLLVSRDGRRAVSSGKDSTLRLWDLDRGTVLQTANLRELSDRVETTHADDWGSRLFWGRGERKVVILSSVWGPRIWDLDRDTLSWTRLDLPYSSAIDADSGVSISPDGASVERAGRLPAIVESLWSQNFTWPPSEEAEILRVAVDEERRVGLGVFSDGSARVWDLRKGTLRHDLPTGEEYAKAAAVSADGRLGLVSGSQLTLWDLRRGSLLATFPLKVNQALFVGERALAATDQGLVVLHLDHCQEVVMAADGRDWLVYSPDGLFDASPDGGRLVTAAQGLRGYRVDQLAVRNNRPDVLLQRLGSSATDRIDYYHRRYEHRLHRLGLDESELSAGFEAGPEATVVDLRRRGRDVTIDIDLSTKRGRLLRYDVFVNDVPVHGTRGRPAEGRSVRVTEQVPLTDGSNKIEVSVVDSSGVESLRDWRQVDQPPGDPGAIHFLGFGVSRHRDPDLDLSYAHKDALDLARAVEGMRDHFEAVHVHTWIDDRVTVEAFDEARDLLEDAGVDDTVIVFVAGHGTHGPGDDEGYYFVTHGTDVGDLAGTAAPFGRIEALLDGIAPRRKLLLLDTCESGERDPEWLASAASGAGARGLTPRTARGLEVVADPSASIRPWLLERNRYIHNDLARRTGAIVFSSSRGSELSYEQAEVENGVFTEELLSALTGVADASGDGWISSDELQDWVASAVALRTDGRQHPTIDRDNLEQVVALPVLPGR